MSAPLSNQDATWKLTAYMSDSGPQSLTQVVQMIPTTTNHSSDPRQQQTGRTTGTHLHNGTLDRRRTHEMMLVLRGELQTIPTSTDQPHGGRA